MSFVKVMNITVERLDLTENLSGLIPAIMQTYRVNGFDDYENVPEQDEFNDVQMYDIIRHKFSDIAARNDLIHSGTISNALNKVHKITEDMEIEEETRKGPENTFERFPWLFEAQYNKITEEEHHDFWNPINSKGNYKLTAFDEGYFSPGNSKWALLISQKSWSQLKSLYPALKFNEMRFLKTGHRIILTEVARRIGLNKLDRLQSLDIYPENPVEFLLAHFDGDTRSQSTNEEFEHHWFDFGNGENNENLMLWSKNLIAEPVVSPLWKPGLKPCELKLNMENGESWFLSIQRLSMEPRFEEDEDKWTQIFKLHLCKEKDGEEYYNGSVTIFNSKIKSPVGLIEDYYNHRGRGEKKMIRHQHLRDVFRAFLHASNRLELVNQPEYYLAHGLTE